MRNFNLNKQETIKAIKAEIIVFGDVSDEFKDDKDVVMAAVLKNEWNLEIASKRLKEDEDIILQVVKKMEEC